MNVDDFYDMLKRSVPKKKKKKKTLFNLRGSQALSYLIFNLIFFHDVRNLLIPKRALNSNSFIS